MNRTNRNWIDEIDNLTRTFKEEFGELSDDEIRWKPDPDRWSISQIIEHIIILNESYYPVVDDLRKGDYRVPFYGKIGFLTSFMGTMIVNGSKPDRKRKIKTFPIWKPSSGNGPGDILAAFEKHQSELKTFIVDCNDLIDNNVVISSPANRWIVYKLETAFDVIIHHEARHFEQAKELKELMKSTT